MSLLNKISRFTPLAVVATAALTIGFYPRKAHAQYSATALTGSVTDVSNNFLTGANNNTPTRSNIRTLQPTTINMPIVGTTTGVAVNNNGNGIAKNGNGIFIYSNPSVAASAVAPPNAQSFTGNAVLNNNTNSKFAIATINNTTGAYGISSANFDSAVKNVILGTDAITLVSIDDTAIVRGTQVKSTGNVGFSFNTSTSLVTYLPTDGIANHKYLNYLGGSDSGNFSINSFLDTTTNSIGLEIYNSLNSSFTNLTTTDGSTFSSAIPAYVNNTGSVLFTTSSNGLDQVNLATLNSGTYDSRTVKSLTGGNTDFSKSVGINDVGDFVVATSTGNYFRVTAPIPEPNTLGLLAPGLCVLASGLAILRRRSADGVRKAAQAKSATRVANLNRLDIS